MESMIGLVWLFSLTGYIAIADRAEISDTGPVARVRAGRQAYRPKLESAGLLPRLNDLLLLQRLRRLRLQRRVQQQQRRSGIQQRHGYVRPYCGSSGVDRGTRDGRLGGRSRDQDMMTQLLGRRSGGSAGMPTRLEIGMQQRRQSGSDTKKFINSKERPPRTDAKPRASSISSSQNERRSVAEIEDQRLRFPRKQQQQPRLRCEFLQQRQTLHLPHQPKHKPLPRRPQSHRHPRNQQLLLLHLRPRVLEAPLPSAKDITDALRLLFNRLDWPASPSTLKLDEDLPLLLSSLSCPVKFQKSVLKAPGTPHSWPTLLALIHWLVQLAIYNDHVSNSTNSVTRSFLQSDGIMVYSLKTYSHFITGDDAGDAALQEEFEGKLGEQMEEARDKVEGSEREVVELQGCIGRMRVEPSAKEVLEKEKRVLENDLLKFRSLIEELERGIEVMEKGLAEKERELEAKERDNRRTCEENEELRRKADAQTVNLRDAERMKRELMALERDISEAEIGRNAWEEKSWDVDTTLAHKFKELQTRCIECNQAIRRLKLGNEFQHTLNSKGATPAEVLGVHYKLTLKPLLSSFLNDVKKSSEKQLEELISLQQHSRENAAKLDGKRSSLTKLQAQIDAISIARLEEVVKQSNEEIQKVESEFLALIDYVSTYKEFMESKISEIKRNLSDTARTVANAQEGSLAAGMDALLNGEVIGDGYGTIKNCVDCNDAEE
ncbi:hypothetical protein Syun_014171 [Stephania yunnanensis]|uniref:Kinetochore protein NDC80 n=1 Tax=Stephania yunnanensis TaxID=152371 RepID=A0AAP0JIT3_9MAGN